MAKISTPKPLKSLAELKAVKHTIDRQAAERLAAQAREKEQQRLASLHKELFARAVGPVRAVRSKNALALQTPKPSPIPVQQLRDDQAVLRETMSDAWDSSSLLDTDEALSFRRPGIGLDVLRKLRRGDWSVQAQLDLHSLRSDEAREALGQFIRESRKQGLRCLRVVHGKGIGSPGKAPVLKAKVQSWLIQKNQVLAFVQATPAQGGAGALLVLLQPVSL